MDAAELEKERHVILEEVAIEDSPLRLPASSSMKRCGRDSRSAATSAAHRRA
ncbi:MAG: hypothetical protein R3B97_06710 [Dehalococcoidia bacterium]